MMHKNRMNLAMGILALASTVEGMSRNASTNLSVTATKNEPSGNGNKENEKKMSIECISDEPLPQRLVVSRFNIELCRRIGVRINGEDMGTSLRGYNVETGTAKKNDGTVLKGKIEPYWREAVPVETRRK